MGINSLAFTNNISTQWTAANNVTGSDYSPTTNPSTISKKITLGTTVANSAAGGADELYSAITTVTTSNTATLNLQNITDIMNTSGVTLARAKYIKVRNLSLTDDPTYGGGASSITVGTSVANGLQSNGSKGWFSNPNSAFDIANGDYMEWGTTGTTGVSITSTNSILKLANNDAVNNAKIQVTIVGGSS
jgi:hypothetical protein